MNIPIHTNANVTKEIILDNIQTEREDTQKWATNNLVKQITRSAQNNHSAPECLKTSLNNDTNNFIPPNIK